MMNIYDCFQYFDEDLLLDIRLNVLNQYVKKFVITEATYTHNGTKKKLNFNINHFKKFKDKINYIVVDRPPPNILKLVDNEAEHRKGEKLILNSIEQASADNWNWVILVGDIGYYSKFGFSKKLTRGISLGDGLDNGRLLGLDIKESFLNKAVGSLIKDN